MTALSHHRARLAPLLLLLVGASWLALLLWAASPYGRYLDHGRWTGTELLDEICSSIPAAGRIAPTLAYAGGWLLMSSAMMLPVTLPLIDTFDRVVAGRRDRASLVGLLIAGYLAAWAGFGLAAHLADAGVHAAARTSPWLAAHAWLPGALVLAIAGAFQFSTLKYRCLERCRSPLSFIAAHWHGCTPRRDALNLGLHHGLWCIGCCWAMMLLMFIVGTGNLGFMLALGAIMAAERNLPQVRRVSAPVGALLLLWATLIVVANAA